MTSRGDSPNFSQYRTVGEAAEFLGVSTATLRNWDRSGKLTPRRHPQNGYRIYLHEELEAVLRSADDSLQTDASIAPLIDWNRLTESEHFVQFYETDEFLVESVSNFAAVALKQQQGSIVIATPEHRNAIQKRLAAQGIDLADAIESGRYIILDAAETLSKFMRDGEPDPRRFRNILGTMISDLSQQCRRIHIFGEMVALLWADGQRDAAIHIEDLWNELSGSHRFVLFCAYPMDEFGNPNDDVPLDGICKCHSRVIPAESYATIDDADQRLHAITLLQQKAQALEAEIAHRGEVEKALSQRERELVDFLENATEGLHKVGPDGTILWANRAEYELLGYSPDEYIGRPITEFHADSDVIADMLEKLQNGETLVNYPARLRCKNGLIKHVLVNSNACFEDGEFAYTRCFTRDVTKQWEAQQALYDADRRKDEFLATLAHELRNPLAPIKHGLELLRRNAGDHQAVAESQNTMHRQLEQMSRLVDDLLDVSRITRNQIELHKQHVDLAAVVASAVETSRPVIDSAGHELLLSLPEKPVFLDADPTRLAQVFSNLLNNSAKYTEPGGRIEVEAALQDRHVVITVRDNGVGISSEELAYVFDMFRQTDRSLERAQGGLGIGLTLVRRIVQLHGGTIDAQSDGLGRGSEFAVRLPAAGTRKTPHEKMPQAKPSALTKRRILLVDDNKDLATTLGRLLQIQENDVRFAHNGLEAIEIAAEFLPEIILMDVGMPKLNGYEATRRIRELICGSDVFIVALSGWGQPEDIQRSTEAGCSAHMVKPVDFAALEQLLANAVPAHD